WRRRWPFSPVRCCPASGTLLWPPWKERRPERGWNILRLEILAVIAGMAAVTYLTRIGFLLLVGKIKLPKNLFRGLKYIPVGILTAFVVPGLLAPDGHVALSLNNHYLFAGLVSALAAYRWKNVFVAMGGGMVVMVILRLYLSGG
ncbi:MAG: AzlD domain-containing protein, partial [Desulfotomaculales bacterium]